MPLFVYKSGTWVIQRVPQPVLKVGIWLVARLAYFAAGKKRELVKRNMCRVLTYRHPAGGVPQTAGSLDRKISQLARHSFESYAQYYTTAAKHHTLSDEEVFAGFTHEGLGHIEEARGAKLRLPEEVETDSDSPEAKPKGVILALPHLGNWEWAGNWLTRHHNVTVSVVAETPANEELHEWMTSFRQDLDMRIIPLDAEAGAAASKALADGHILCLLCDRDIQGNGIEVEFFGETTTLPAGPATLAMRSGVALVPAAVYVRDGLQHGMATPPLDTARNKDVRFRDQVQQLTQELAHRLEELIEQAPEQWHLMSPNWPSDPGYAHGSALASESGSESASAPTQFPTPKPTRQP